VVAFLAGYVSNARGAEEGSRSGRVIGRDEHTMSDRVRSAAPSAWEAANEAGQYVTRNAREYPFSGLLLTSR
jgi:hypothetical protein